MRKIDQEFEVEEWRDVPGFPGYRVSNMGNIDGCLTAHGFGEWKRKSFRKKEYGFSVQLSKNGKKENFYVNRIVASAFLPEFSPEKRVCFLNHNPFDCNLENLIVLTPFEQQQFNIKAITRGSDVWCSKLNEEEILAMRSFRAEGKTFTQLGECFNVDRTTAWKICTKKRWRHI